MRMVRAKFSQLRLGPSALRAVGGVYRLFALVVSAKAITATAWAYGPSMAWRRSQASRQLVLRWALRCWSRPFWWRMLVAGWPRGVRHLAACHELLNRKDISNVGQDGVVDVHSAGPPHPMSRIVQRRLDQEMVGIAGGVRARGQGSLSKQLGAAPERNMFYFRCVWILNFEF